MIIRFVSSLNADDERRLAEALLAGVAGFLNALPIVYTIRIETMDGHLVEHYQSPGPVSARPTNQKSSISAASEKNVALGGVS